MSEAEYLLPDRQRKTESLLSISVNGEERVPSPLPTEKPQEAPSVSVDAGRPSSPNMAPNGSEPHLIKNSAAAQANTSKACRKKKKCLSDIFGHIVGGTKESSAITNVVEQFHMPSRTLKEEPKDSPYADLESVPMLHRPKRTAVSPVQEVNRLVRKERGSAKAKTKLTEKVNQSTDSFNSAGVSTKLPFKDEGSEQHLGGSDELLHHSTEKHSMTLPASSRLMTRALKAEEETDLKDALTTGQIPTDANADDSPDKTPSSSAVKNEMSPTWDSPSNPSSSTNHILTKRRARKPDKKQIRNGSLIKPKFVGSSLSTVEAVKVKTENLLPDQSSSSSTPSPTLSPMDAFQDPKELTFKSLVKEDNSDSELTVFRPDSNYKFSTFLMLLKDIHDTREKEGKPLTMPPSPVLIKAEPLVIPTSTAGDLNSCDVFNQRIKMENGSVRKPAASQQRGAKTKSSTKAIMSADTYHCEGLKQRRKQRLPAKLKLNIPGLSLDLADLAYGREFVSGHADLADPLSRPPVAADASASYLEKNSGSTVAPKKRWQLVEEAAGNKSEALSELLPELNGSYTMRTSPDLDHGEERHGEGAFYFSDPGGAAGKEAFLCCHLLS